MQGRILKEKLKDTNGMRQGRNCSIQRMTNLKIVIGVKGKGKGKVRNTAIPPNQLKRYITRSQNIPAKSDDEYASESD